MARLIMLTDGEYSDFGVIGHYMFPDDVTPEGLMREFREWFGVPPDGFAEWWDEHAWMQDNFAHSCSDREMPDYVRFGFSLAGAARVWLENTRGATLVEVDEMHFS